MDAASEEYLQRLSDSVSRALEGNLTGIYLHGSAVLGGFDPRQSDLDVLVVVSRRMTATQSAAVVDAVSEKALPCPAAGLEMSVVTEMVAANPNAPAPAFELHLTTAASDSKVVHGRDGDGDPDLVLHFSVCREKGKSLGRFAARGVREVFGAVPRKHITAQLHDELQWAASEAPRHYAVLNASRAWRFLATGQLVSKVAGGEWALSRMEDDDRMEGQGGMIGLIEAALKKQTGAEAILEADDVQRFIGFVLDMLNQDVDRNGRD
ncbi:hypothetical protein V2A60_001570 [Cordyceps javanica]|uniref:Streptomycin adenylyltransferase n=1 Tax=Cordyceps javanica TaxID=43265 RepID=A0A545VFK7_9HYPO|nr:streptomycin adenylyltransferase [Cordyceps javanica]TQW11673.1 streptomycin adenylyltransferase [Cordyceps javanica]